ncbi:MAG: AAC(3) family N-acetyltransferase [Rickettsiaceae bacterium]
MYKSLDIIKSLKYCGVQKGDILFSHSNIGFWGSPEGVYDKEEICKLILEAIFEVIGQKGTLVVPTYTYSFGSGSLEKVFSVKNCHSKMGVFAEYIRMHPDSHRSADPMLSVAAIGANAKSLTADVSDICFGSGSFWDRFYKAKGKVCNINFDAGSTFIHYVEKCLGISYRKEINFTGVVINKNECIKNISYFGRDLNSIDSKPCFEMFSKLAVLKKYAKNAEVGRGQVTVITSEDTFSLIKSTLLTEPSFLIEKGRKCANRGRKNL